MTISPDIQAMDSEQTSMTDTPPATAAQYDNRWRRLGASLIDIYLVYIVWLIPALLLHLDTNFPSAPALSVVYALAQTLSLLAYRILLHVRTGQTIGKMVVMVRLSGVAGERVSLGQAVLRESVPLVINLAQTAYILLNLDEYTAFMAQTESLNFPVGLLVGIAVGALWTLLDVAPMLFTDKRRAVHDYIAGTVVVREDPEQGLHYRIIGSSATATALALIVGPMLLLSVLSVFTLLSNMTMGLILLAICLAAVVALGVPLIILNRRMAETRRFAAWGGLLGILAIGSASFAESDWPPLSALGSLMGVGAFAVFWVVYRRIRTLLQ